MQGREWNGARAYPAGTGGDNISVVVNKSNFLFNPTGYSSDLANNKDPAGKGGDSNNNKDPAGKGGDRNKIINPAGKGGDSNNNKDPAGKGGDFDRNSFITQSLQDPINISLNEVAETIIATISTVAWSENTSYDEVPPWIWNVQAGNGRVTIALVENALQEARLWSSAPIVHRKVRVKVLGTYTEMWVDTCSPISLMSLAYFNHNNGRFKLLDVVPKRNYGGLGGSSLNFMGVVKLEATLDSGRIIIMFAAVLDGLATDLLCGNYDLNFNSVAVVAGGGFTTTVVDTECAKLILNKESSRVVTAGLAIPLTSSAANNENISIDQLDGRAETGNGSFPGDITAVNNNVGVEPERRQEILMEVAEEIISNAQQEVFGKGLSSPVNDSATEEAKSNGNVGGPQLDILIAKDVYLQSSEKAYTVELQCPSLGRLRQGCIAIGEIIADNLPVNVVVLETEVLIDEDGIGFVRACLSSVSAEPITLEAGLLIGRLVDCCVEPARQQLLDTRNLLNSKVNIAKPRIRTFQVTQKTEVASVIAALKKAAPVVTKVGSKRVRFDTAQSKECSKGKAGKIKINKNKRMKGVDGNVVAAPLVGDVTDLPNELTPAEKILKDTIDVD